MAGEFRRKGEDMLRGLAQGLYKAGIDIMNESQREVPVEFSILKASARVLEPVVVGDSMVVTVGYGYGEEVNPRDGKTAAGYAIPVHERLELHHEPPTKAKFLEDPALAYAPRLEETLAIFITRALRNPNTGRLDLFLEELA